MGGVRSAAMRRVLLYAVLAIFFLFGIWLCDAGTAASMRCNHASLELQEYLSNGTQRIQSNVPIGRTQHWHALRFGVTNLLATELGGCYMPFELHPGAASAFSVDHLVARGSTICDASNTPTAAEMALVSAAVMNEANNISAYFTVRFLPDVVPVVVAKSQHQCATIVTNLPLDPANRDTEINVGVVLTAFPFPDVPHWRDVPMWIAPCSFDVNGRPVAMVLNLNIPLLRRDQFSRLGMIVKHQLLHGLGFSFSTQDQLVSVFEPKLAREVNYLTRGSDAFLEAMQCKTRDRFGIPLDDEFGLAQLQQRGLVAAHLEPRVVSTDIMAWSQYNSTAPLHISNASIDALEGTQLYHRASNSLFVNPLWPAAGAGCGLLSSPCNTSEGGRERFFCFPSSPSPTDPDSLQACSNDRMSVATCEILLWPSAVPPAFSYFNVSQYLVGNDPASDFCPRGIDAQAVSCQGAGPDSDASGATYSPSSRCFETAGTRKGIKHNDASESQSPNGLRCLAARCPLGMRIEFHLRGDASSEWIPCLQDGSAGDVSLSGLSTHYSGTVSCPSAASLCTRALIPTVVHNGWKTVPGYALEYAAIVDENSSVLLGTVYEAAKACEEVGGSLPFVPDRQWGSELVKNVSVGAFWTGFRNRGDGSGWDKTYSYEQSFLGTPSLTTALDSTVFVQAQGTIQPLSGTQQRGMVCTRVKTDLSPSLCRIAGLCHYNAANPMDSATFFVLSPLRGTSVNDQNPCLKHGADLLSLNSDPSSWGLYLDKLSSTLGEVRGLWTHVQYIYPAAQPAWSVLVNEPFLDWGSGSSCFVLATSLTNASQLVLLRADCGAAFPVLCIRPNLLVKNATVAATPYAVSVLTVPQSRAAAAITCTYLGGALSPLIPGPFADFIIASTAVLRSPGEVESAYKLIVSTELPAGLLGQTKDALAQLGIGAECATVSLLGDTVRCIADESVPMMYACVTYSREMLASPCPNATWCPFVPERSLLRITEPPKDVEQSEASCRSLGGNLSFSSALMVSVHNLDALSDLFNASTLVASWTAMQYSGALQKFVVGGIPTDLDVNDPSRVDADLHDGWCVAIYATPAATWRLRTYPCDFRLPYVCHRSPAAEPASAIWSSWVGDGDEKYLEYTFLSVSVTRDSAISLCAALDGDLAYLPMVPANASRLNMSSLAARGLSVGAADTPWFGMKSSTGPTYRTTFGIIVNGTSTEEGCYTLKIISGTPTEATYTKESSCMSLRPVLCARYSSVVSVVPPSHAYRGVQLAVQVDVPPVPLLGRTGRVVVRLSCNLSDIVPAFVQPLSIAPATRVWANWTAPCSNRDNSATTVGFRAVVVSDSAGVRRTATQAMAIPLMPCVNVTYSTDSLNSVIVENSNITVVSTLAGSIDSGSSLHVVLRSATSLMTKEIELTSATTTQSEQFLAFSSPSCDVLTGRVSQCFPADICADDLLQTEVSVLPYSTYYANPVSCTAPSSVFVGTQSPSTGHISLRVAPEMDSVTLQLFGTSAEGNRLYVEPSTIENVTDNPVAFNVSAVEVGTYILSSHVVSVQHTNQSCTPRFRNETLVVASISASARYPLRVALSTASSAVYPGQRVWVSIEPASESAPSAPDAFVQIVPSTVLQLVNGTGSMRLSGVGIVVEAAVTSDVTSVVSPSDPLDSTVSFQVQIALSGSDNYLYVLPMALPQSLAVMRKSVTVQQVPKILMAGGSVQYVVLALPYAILRTATVQSVCNSTDVLVEPAVALWAAGLQVLSLNVSSPPTTSFVTENQRISVCHFSVSQASLWDVVPVMLQAEITVWPRSSITIKPVPRLIAPGTNFSVTLSISYDPRSPPRSISVAWDPADYNMSCLFYSESLGPLSSLPRSYAIEYITRIPRTSKTQSITMTFAVNDTNAFVSPTPLYFEVVSIVTVIAVPPQNFIFTQSIGAVNSRTIELRISSIPRMENVTARLQCAGNHFIANFTPTAVVWTPKTDVAMLTQSVSYYGRVFGQCFLVLSVQGTGAEIESANKTAVFEKNISFVQLLRVQLRTIDSLSPLFVGESSSKQVLIQLFSVPSKFLNVSFITSGPQVQVVPPWTVWDSSSSESQLLKLFSVIGRCQGSQVSISATVSTQAGEYDNSIENSTIVFDVLPKSVVFFTASAQSSVPLLSESVFCGGTVTSKALTVMVSRTPEGPTEQLIVRFQSSTPLISISPGTLHFGHGSTLNTSIAIVCSAEDVHPAQASLQIQLDGPTQYNATGPNITLNLLSLNGFYVLDFPRRIVVGNDCTFSIKPEGSTPPQRLMLQLSTNCGTFVTLKDPSAMTWEGQLDQIPVALHGKECVAKCTVSLVQTSNSTATDFVHFAYTGTVDVVSYPKILFTPNGSFTEDSLMSGWTLQVDVTSENGDPDTFVTTNMTKFSSIAIEDTPSLLNTQHCVYVSSTVSRQDDGFLQYISSNVSRHVSLVLGANGRTAFIRVLPAEAHRFVLSEVVMFRFSSACFATGCGHGAPLQDFSNYTITLEPQEQSLASVQKAVVQSAAIVTAVLSIAAGPSMATQGPKLAILAAAGLCPVQDWRTKRQLNLDTTENLFNIYVGPTEDLGVYLGAAIFNAVAVAVWFALHLVICFLIFAYKRDQAVGDKSFGRAVAAMRLPSADLFPVVYFAPFITEHALRVVIYSENTNMRTIAFVAFVASTLGVPCWYASVLRLPGKLYLGVPPEAKYTCMQKILKKRGTWRLESGAPDMKLLLKYGMFFEEFVGPRYYYGLIDVTTTVLMGLINAIEPTNQQGCFAKYTVIAACFLVLAVSAVFLLPYRSHFANALFGTIAVAELVSALIAILAIIGRNGEWGPDAASLSAVVIANLILFKSLADLVALTLKLLAKGIGKKMGGHKRKRFKMRSEETLAVKDFFPSKPGDEEFVQVAPAAAAGEGGADLSAMLSTTPPEDSSSGRRDRPAHDDDEMQEPLLRPPGDETLNVPQDGGTSLVSHEQMLMSLI